MSLVTTAPPIACVNTPPAGVDADLLVVPWFSGDAPSRVSGLDEAVGGEAGRALASGEFAAGLFDLFVTPVTDGKWKARRLALIGAGKAADFGIDAARKLATVAALAARQRR